MTREAATKLRELLLSLVSKIEKGWMRTTLSVDGQESASAVVTVIIPVSSKEELKEWADEIEKEFL